MLQEVPKSRYIDAIATEIIIQQKISAGLWFSLEQLISQAFDYFIKNIVVCRETVFSLLLLFKVSPQGNSRPLPNCILSSASVFAGASLFLTTCTYISRPVTRGAKEENLQHDKFPLVDLNQTRERKALKITAKTKWKPPEFLLSCTGVNVLSSLIKYHTVPIRVN